MLVCSISLWNPGALSHLPDGLKTVEGRCAVGDYMRSGALIYIDESVIGDLYELMILQYSCFL